MRYAVIKADGTHEVVEKELGYKELQKLVAAPNEDSAFYEVVQGRGISIYMNEDGKYLPLRPNEAVTRFAHANRMISPSDTIVGDCVVTGAPDEEGMDTDLPEGILEQIIPQA